MASRKRTNNMIMQKLYKKRSDGKIQEWSIEVEENRYRTISGINGEDSSLVVSNWTECKGKNHGKKNETTDNEQAIREALAIWQKKLDSKYSQNIEAVNQVKYISPMLAKEYKEYKDELQFPVYSDPKLDGIRCVVSSKGAFSRNGKKFTSVPEIEEVLIPLCDKHKVAFDGELYCHSLSDNFNKICSIVRSDEPSKDHIEYWIYDICDTKMSFSERKEKLSKILSEQDNKNIKIVISTKCHSYSDIDDMYEEYLDSNYEGQIIRQNKEYENKRTKSLLKRKEFITDEYLILDVIEGIGNRSETAGYFKLIGENKEEFKGNIKGNFEYLAKLLKNKEQLIGKYCTVKYFRLTPRGVPKWGYVVAIRDYE